MSVFGLSQVLVIELSLSHTIDFQGGKSVSVELSQVLAFELAPTWSLDGRGGKKDRV